MAQNEGLNGATATLYFGLFLLMSGLVFTVIGLGEKGFTSWELRFVGPIVALFGLVFVGARVVLCFVMGLKEDQEDKEDLMHLEEEQRIDKT